MSYTKPVILTLAKFHELSKDFSVTPEGDLDVSKYHSIKVAENFNVVAKKTDGKPASSLNYIAVSIEDKSTGTRYPAKFKISLSDKVVSGGIKSPAERNNNNITDADPTCNFSSKDNPVFYEALNNYYTQVLGIISNMKKTGKFVEKNDKKAIAANPNAMKVDSMKTSKSPITTHTKDEVVIDNPFYRYAFKRSKDVKSLFTDPIRDTRFPIKKDGKIINFEPFKVNGEVVNVSNIHLAINPGTIHLGEFDMSSLSCSGMGISHRATFSRNSHIIVYREKIDRTDISNLIDTGDLEALNAMNAGTAKLEITVTETDENDEEGDDDGDDINIDLGED